MTNIDKCVYQLGEQYLSSIKMLTIQQVRTKYLTAPPRLTSLPKIYRALLGSATGGNRDPGIYKGLIGGIDQLDSLLFHFDPVEVRKKYQNNAALILTDIIKHFALENKRTKVRWKKKKDGTREQFGGDLVGRKGGKLDDLSKTIADGAALLGQYSSASDFYSFLDESLDNYKRQYKHLPLEEAEIESKIDLTDYLRGKVYKLGPALTPDFLKDISFGDFIKPDVHVTEIFKAFNLSTSSDPKSVFRSAHRVANNAETTVFAVDKVFYHIGEHALGQRGLFIKWGKQEIKAGKC